jgi:hypothetical protein
MVPKVTSLVAHTCTQLLRMWHASGVNLANMWRKCYVQNLHTMCLISRVATATRLLLPQEASIPVVYFHILSCYQGTGTFFFSITKIPFEAIEWKAGVKEIMSPWISGNKIFYCIDRNTLRSLVSIVMQLNPSVNKKVGHFFLGTTITVTPGLAVGSN